MGQSPNDSTALSVCSQAEYLFGDSPRSALRLAELAIRADPLNCVAWAGLSNLQTAHADYSSGLHSATKAVDTSFGSGSTYYFEFYRCMAATGLRDYRKAIEYATTSSLLSFKFASPRRYLVALRAVADDRVGLSKTIRRMQLIEPSFELASLLDKTYPVSTLRRLPLIDELARSPLRSLEVS